MVGAGQPDKNPESKEREKAVSIPGTVILYNPELFVIDNIMSYIDCLDVLYVVDNSDRPDLSFISAIKKISKVCYISLGGNHGIAEALNTSVSLALDHGYDWLLTMDQDSRFEENIIPKLFHCLNYYDKDMVGMICARYTRKNRYVEVYGKQYNEILVSITSGSLINLTVFRKHGPFMEKLFIDHVDHEYCLRLRRHGYKIIQVKNAFIRHMLGDSKGYLVCRSSNHVPFRRYFMTRNRFYVANMYKNDRPRFFWTEMLRFTGELVKILLFEKEKYKKLRNIAMGYLDYKRNRFNRDLKDL
ncbi:glycosyltransferase family 2 protein [Desulfobacula sp.]|uniref:glycosyltransferase family 2 protein n=1 Tax=Desulfobacula sp. TaxID=2593537 RepID=UPI0025B8C7EA|nr:glycosyltransferase family 2 protein [Desulfobacula sp.]MBC2704934.1 glycosyltransferase family 2 protein [Desulfobacula sp.]